MESNPFSGFSESRCARLGAADWQTNRGSKQWPNKGLIMRHSIAKITLNISYKADKRVFDANDEQ
jgi:hypothetical protein